MAQSASFLRMSISIKPIPMCAPCAKVVHYQQPDNHLIKIIKMV